MDRPPATQGRRANTTVAERKLDKLCACLYDAMSSPRPRCPDLLHAEIKGKIDFLRSLLAAERECHGGERPGYLAEAGARFAVLKDAFDQWARRTVAAPEPAEKEMGEPEEEATGSGCACSCTDWCQEAAAAAGDAEYEAVETRQELASDGVSKDRDAEREAVETREEATLDATAEKLEAMGTRKETTSDATAEKLEAMGTREEATSDAIAKKRAAEREAAAETRRRTVQRRWWKRSAAWCGAAGVVAVVAVGLAMELAAVAHHNVNVYVVPT